ncbi:AMP-binding protein [Natrinema sp. 1APR25-10V2]|uniref:acyl-CoA synthetase n=1 Tax=Natrinema sp. 1APR25-10V2 TaxID=2951081 RepID=UPI002876AC04|nr:AMP-binding protein [Natrinema sp. 1APR25-10V2]MDS0476949.1 AMP-binding protein [Natrinema sp. 1APR25-10V2]
MFLNQVTDYESAVESFSWEEIRDECDWGGQEALNFAHESVDRHATDGDTLAILWLGEGGEEKRYTFRDLTRRSNKVANLLTDLGIEAGDRVITYLPRIPEHYITVLGTVKTGAVFGAINERYGPDGIAHRLADSEAETIVTTAANRETIAAAIEGIDSVENVIVLDRDDGTTVDGDIDYYDRIEDASPEFKTVRTGPETPAFLYYTSGTTGPAKGVVHGHDFTIGNASFAKLPAGLQDGDLYWCTADLGWLTGLNPFGALFWKVPIIVYEGEFDPEAWVTILDEHPITVLFSVPTAYRMLWKQEELLSDRDLELRTLLSVGEPLNAPVVEWAKEQFGVPILDTYGCSEMYGTVVANYPFDSWEVKPGSMGKPYPGIDTKIVEPGTLEEVDQGKTGEIAIKEFPSTFLEYWNRPEKTADARIGEWVLTDDLAREDDGGYYWFEGRADDVILSSGYRIGPFEIESQLVEHDAVTEAAVIGVPDEQRGERVKAFVVPATDVDATDKTRAEIKQFVRDRLAAHEYPRDVEFTDTLPKTVTGKIRRSELRERSDHD